MSRRELVLEGPRRLTVREQPARALGPTEVRVCTHSVGICGSDVHGYTGTNDRRAPGVVMGHEASGIVIERGVDAGPAVGSRVAINPAVTCGVCEFCTSGNDHRCPQRRLYGCVPELPGAFADSFVVESLNAVAFEGPVPLEWGALAEPFAVGDHGVGLLQGPMNAGVLIVGGGPIGLGAAIGCRRRGLSRVVVSEPNEHRRTIAGLLGFESFDPSSPPEMAAFDAAVDCVAVPQSLELAMRLTRPGAEISIVGLGQTTMPFPIEALVVGERVVRGSFNYSRHEFTETVKWIATAEFDVSPVIEARVNLDDVTNAFERYADATNEAVKTLCQPDGSWWPEAARRPERVASSEDSRDQRADAPSDARDCA